LGFQDGTGIVTFTGTTSGTVLVSGTTVGSYTYSGGTLIVDFTGSSVTQAQVQTVLRAVSYSNSSDAPSTANRTVSFSLTDPEGHVSATKAVTVVVEAVNDAPTISATGGTSTLNRSVTAEVTNTISTTAAKLLSYTTPTATSTGLQIADVDSSSSTIRATLSVSSGMIEVFANTTKQASTASYTIGGVTITGMNTGSIVMTGTAANINALLAGTTTTQFLYQAGSTNGSATVTFAVSDLGNTGTGGVKTASQQVGTITTTVPTVTGTMTGTVTEDAATLTATGTLSGTVGTKTFIGNTLSTTALGTLTSSGSTWTYTLNNANANVQALAAGDVIKETYSVVVGTKTTFVTINIVGTNDAPTLAATAAASNFTENGSAVTLFSAATAAFGAGELGQSFTQLGFTVANVYDGDQITIDGSTIYIDTSSTSTVTSLNGYTVTVSLVGTTATVTVTTPEINAAMMQTLVTGLQYGSTGDDPTNGGANATRVITLNALKDSGGTANGGSDTWSTGVVRTVTVSAVNDGPTIITSPATVYPLTTLGVTTDFLTAYDPDSTALTYTITSAISNGTLLRNGVALSNGSTFTQADVIAGLITFAPNAVASDTSVSINLSVSDGSLTSAGALTLNLLATAPTVTISDVTVSESSPYVMFTVNVDGQTSSAMTFTPTLISATATVGTDTGATLEWWNGSAWVATPVTLAAGSGVREVLVRAAVTADINYEGRENFLFSTGAFSGTNIVNQSGATAVGTIVDDGSSTNVFLAGNTTGSATAGTADNDMPTATISAITDDVGAVTGSISNGAYSDDTAPLIGGTLSVALNEDLVLAVYRDGVKIGNATVSGTSWTFADSGLSSGSSYSYSVRVEDPSSVTNGASSAAYSITVDTVGPSISSAASVSINENTGSSQVVYTATSTDSGSGGTVYSLKPATGDVTAFSINSTTGAVTLTGNPNFETKSSYTFTVVATDAAGNASEKIVTLAVNNLDEVAPTITSSTTATAINENSGAGQVVYTATSTDAGDIATGSTSYSLKPA
ncbi:MAG: cadherin-like domain-containing protein, partial [Lacisediminimonas sp.]|nr:cadherin-like domain-containing protein [Lacisediminimonas sp.]